MPVSSAPHSQDASQFLLFEEPSERVVRELQELAMCKRIFRRQRASTGKYGGNVATFLSENEIRPLSDSDPEPVQCELAIGDKPEPQKDEDDEKAVNPFVEEEISLGAVIRLHVYILAHMYHLLRDQRSSMETREWVLDWVMEPILMPPTRANSERPLSLQACANAYGIRADRLQMLFLSKFGLHHFIEQIDDWVEMDSVEEAVFTEQYWANT